MKNVGHNRYQIEISQLIKTVAELNDTVSSQIAEINMYKNCVTETQLKYQELFLKNLDIQDTMSNLTAQNLTAAQNTDILQKETALQINNLQNKITILEQNNNQVIQDFENSKMANRQLQSSIDQLIKSQQNSISKNEELAKENSSLHLLVYNLNKEIEFLKELNHGNHIPECQTETNQPENVNENVNQTVKVKKDVPLKRVSKTCK